MSIQHCNSEDLCLFMERMLVKADLCQPELAREYSTASVSTEASPSVSSVVPKDVPGEDAEKTTLVIRNLANNPTVKDIVAELTRQDFRINMARLFPRKGSYSPYAFVDFVSPAEAQRFIESVEGDVFFQRKPRRKDIQFSKKQGSEAIGVTDFMGNSWIRDECTL